MRNWNQVSQLKLFDSCEGMLAERSIHIPPQRSILVSGLRHGDGVDWHSSRITTSVMGALKRGSAAGDLQRSIQC
jgi:hypothetical protein